MCALLDKHPNKRIDTLLHIDSLPEKEGLLDQRQSVLDELCLSRADELEDCSRIATDHIHRQRGIVLDDGSYCCDALEAVSPRSDHHGVQHCDVLGSERRSLRQELIFKEGRRLDRFLHSLVLNSRRLILYLQAI